MPRRGWLSDVGGGMSAGTVAGPEQVKGVAG